MLSGLLLFASASPVIMFASSHTTFSGTVYWLNGDKAPTTVTAYVGNVLHTIEVGATTAVRNRQGQTVGVAEFQVGDRLTIVGQQRAAFRPTIAAVTIQNHSLPDGVGGPLPPDNEPLPLQGIVHWLHGDRRPTSLTVQMSGSFWSIKVLTTTAIRDRFDQPATLGSFRIGDTLQLSGQTDRNDSTAIIAEVVRNSNLPR